MKPPKPIMQFLAAFAVASGAANAAVTIVDTDSRSGFGTSTTINFSTTVTGGNVLVVGAYADAGGAGSGVNITFGGNAATGRRNSDRGFMAYYQTATLDTSVTINLTSSATSVGLVLWELSNVDLTAGVANGAGDTMTTTVANTFVVGTGFRNGNLISYNGAAVFDTQDIPVFVIQNGSGFIVGQTGSIGGASGLAATAGSQNISWNNDGDGSAIAFGFVAVPEPSAALLGAIGLIALLRRRRSA